MAATLNLGQHSCLLYDDPREQLPVLLPFIREGLARGEQCTYVADDLTPEMVRDALSAYGIDVQGTTERGALRVWSRSEWRQPGALESARKAQAVREDFVAARASGFTGMRYAVEMTWALDPDIDVASLRHFEATVDAMCTSAEPVRIVCQYSLRRSSPALVGAGLSTHSRAIVDGRSQHNPYFDAPLVLAGAANVPPDAARLDWMLAQLRAHQASVQSVTERSRASAARRARILAARHTDRLRSLASEASIRLRRRGDAGTEFLGLVSHDLRTPVATILGSAQVLRTGTAISEPDRLALLAAIEEEALRLGRALDDLFVLAVQDASALAIQPVMLRHLIAQQLDRHRLRYPERGLDFTASPFEPPAAADPMYVEQIFRNLLDNAERYSPPTAPIEVASTVERDQLIVRVLDRGAGIPSEVADGLLTDFFRPTGPTGGKGGGRGVGAGLAASRRLVEAHGGQIWTRPREDGGTESGFTLPVAEWGVVDGN